MTDEFINRLAIFIMVPSAAVFIGLSVARNVGVPAFVRRRRAGRQEAALRRLPAAGDRLELDWVRYREVPKARIRELLGASGWRYAGERIGPDVWTLRFTSDAAAAPPADPGAVLAAELRDAAPGVDGTYLLHTEDYAGLDLLEIKRAANGAGWLVRQVLPGSPQWQLVLVRRGTVDVSSPDVTFFSGVPTAELKKDPAVRARAEELRRETGIDALSEVRLNDVRRAHRGFRRRFNRCVLLGSLCGVAGGVLLLALLRTARLPSDEPATYVVLGLPIAALLLAACAIARAMGIRRQWRATTGGFRDARAELDRLYRTG